MKGPELLSHYEDNWETEMGAWFPGERVVLRGKDVLADMDFTSWMEYFLFAVTGKQSPELANLIQLIWVSSTSYPDPRLWNNRVATLAASSRSTGVLAFSSGIAVSEATIYGLKPIKGTCDFLVRSKEKLATGLTLAEAVKEEIKKYKAIYGYGRPLVARDERIEPVVELAKKLGFGHGEHLKTAFEVEDILNKKYRMNMNIAAVYAALMLDAGLTVQQAYYMACLSFSAGMIAPYIEALEKPEESFFPLSVSRINFSGRSKNRVWGE